MRKRTPPDGPKRSPRRGFTLVEILMVVVVIGILLALLLPAIGRARTSATEARVVAEIKQLEAAIAAFKAKYGVEPPSRITIYLTGDGWAGDGPSKGFIKRMFPQFDFNMGGADSSTTGTPGTHYPSTWGSNFVLNSGECLLFFLGGIIENGAPQGFAKNPAYPFAPPSAPLNFGANRNPPFVEFDPGRIRDTGGGPMPEYLDPIPNQSRPYLYFSSYEGKGYQPNELPVFALQDVYRTWSGSGTVPAPPGSTQSLPAQKPQTFQIISPGYDADYGSGGVYNPQLANSGLTSAAGQPDVAAYDNLTNFASGRLKP